MKYDYSFVNKGPNAVEYFTVAWISKPQQDCQHVMVILLRTLWMFS